MNGEQFNLVEQKLPDNFFQNIWEMEMDIELNEDFKYDKLLALFNLYSRAIQYYSLTCPEKVMAFQNRMEGYLTKKDTLKSLTKFNTEQKASGLSNSGTIYPQVRGRAKTHFKMKAKEIKNEEIKKQVKEVLKDTAILMKYDKKNLKSFINEEMEKQRDNFGDNLFRKREFNNLERRKRRTVAVKFGKKKEIENKFNFDKNGKFSKNKKLEESSSELNISKLQNENNESEFLNLLNEIDGGKSMISNSEDSGSIIGDDYKGEESSENDSDSDSEEEEEEEDEDDNNSNNSSFNNSSNFNKSIDSIEKINNIINTNKKREYDGQLNRSKDYIMNKFKVVNENRCGW